MSTMSTHRDIAAAYVQEAKDGAKRMHELDMLRLALDNVDDQLTHIRELHTKALAEREQLRRQLADAEHRAERAEAKLAERATLTAEQRARRDLVADQVQQAQGVAHEIYGRGLGVTLGSLAQMIRATDTDLGVLPLYAQHAATELREAYDYAQRAKAEGEQWRDRAERAEERLDRRTEDHASGDSHDIRQMCGELRRQPGQRLALDAVHAVCDLLDDADHESELPETDDIRQAIRDAIAGHAQ